MTIETEQADGVTSGQGPDLPSESQAPSQDGLTSDPAVDADDGDPDGEEAGAPDPGKGGIAPDTASEKTPRRTDKPKAANDEAPQGEPRRAGPTAPPVIPPKKRPPARTKTTRTASAARPSGSAVPAPVEEEESNGIPVPQRAGDEPDAAPARARTDRRRRATPTAAIDAAGALDGSELPKPRRQPAKALKADAVEPEPVEPEPAERGEPGRPEASEPELEAMAVEAVEARPDQGQEDKADQRAALSRTPRKTPPPGSARPLSDTPKAGPASEAADEKPEEDLSIDKEPKSRAWRRPKANVEPDDVPLIGDEGWSEVAGVSVAIASQEDEVAVEAPKDLDVESKTGGGAIHGAGFAQMIGAQDSEAVEVADSPEEDLGPVRPDFMRMVVDGVPMSDGGPITRVVPASKVDAPPRRAGGRPKAVDNEQLVAPPGAPVPVGGEAGPAMVPASARPRPNSPAETGRSSGTPRSVKVQLTRVSPWSVMKLAFLLSVGLGIALVVAVFVVWNVLDRSHLFIEVNDQIANIVGQESAADFDILQYVERGKVMAAATGVAVIDVVAITILATLGSLIYNITAALVGGIHVTLRND